MANYHALKQTKEGNTVTFVFHYSTPSGTNSNGVTYSDCLVYDKAPSGSLVPNLDTDDPTEYADIQTGDVYEETITLKFADGLSNAAKLTATNNMWTSRNTLFQTRIPVVYKLYLMPTPE